MTYPNAANGVKKLLIAEILALVAVFLILSAVVVTFATDGDALMAIGAFGLIAGIIAIVALIIRIVGISKASKDEPSFRIALFAVIAGLVVSFLNGFIGALVELGVFGTILSLVGTILEIVCFVYCVIGIRKLADHLEHYDISNFGKTILYAVLGIGIFQIIVSLISSFIPGAVSNILSIVGSLASIALEVVFILYLVKAKKMLEEN